MNRSEFLAYAAERYSIEADYPFESDTTIAVFRHTQNRKWFAVVMTIPYSKLGSDSPGAVNIVNLKCDPDVKYSFLQERGIFPAYHMNKRHWITVALDGSADDEKIKWLLDVSYDLTGIKRKVQRK